MAARTENQHWNDEADAFFIRQAENSERKKKVASSQLTLPNVLPEGMAVKRVPSICGFVDDVQTDNRTVLEEPDQAAFYLDNGLSRHGDEGAPLTPTTKQLMDLLLLRDSQAIADNLKEEICIVLLERNITAEELLAKGDEQVDFLFPDPTVRDAVMNWRHLELWKRDQLPTEALRLVNAAKVGNLDVIREITQRPTIPPLGKKLLIEHRDDASHSRTPLMHATRHGHLAVVGYLVKTQNADVHARDDHKLQSMAIHFAAQGGYVDIVRFMAGVDPGLVEAKNVNGDTPLNMAAVGGKLNVVECLVSEKHANLENRGQYGMTPLLCCSEKGHFAVAKFLVEKGADICAKDDRYSDMGVHWSARFGHLEILTYFIDIKPSLIEAVDSLGRTPLHQASLGGHLAIAKYLVEKGADLDAVTSSGDHMSNALHLAAYFGREDVVAFLLECKPDLLEVENKEGKTAYMLAKEEKHVEIQNFLESLGARTTKRKGNNEP